ncbi:MAG: YecA family protein [Deltaproteobacteria bacterium]
MQSAKVGRNDPCPCGSGKKYKKCCGELQEFLDPAIDPFTRMNNLMTAVKVKLDQFYEREIKRVRRELQKHFLRFALEATMQRDHESIFSDWLWFDQIGDDGDTLAYLYLKNNSGFMETPLKDCLAALNLSYLSVYEVISAEGFILELRDIFLDRNCEVLLKEPWEPTEDKLSALLLGRLVRMADGNVFSGMVLMVDNDGEQMEFLTEHLQHACDLQGDTLVNLLKFKGEIIYGLFNHAFKKTHITLNHVEAARINDKEKEMFIDRIQDSYHLVHDNSGFQWFEPINNEGGYNRIAVGDQYILTSHEVLQDLNDWKTLQKEIWPEKEFIVLSDRFIMNPPPLEMAGLWFTIVKDRECEAWFNTPHTELKGKTPSQVLTEENGRDRLDSLLDDMYDRVDNDEARELLDYMRLRIQ